ncbi:gliding motility-associated protein GldE [Coprobacter secundus]|uniref:Hemolysin n=1 Tax=Coprobacter secundus subsp. similis TaxID=2751153 RepID=A0A7G1HVP6_9BACT|nr:gliding motility-associated protein GldE [Coprobacter secundus]BCI63630.1 hemolysin [Coprobacter secundus subsp. similis]CCY38883.1 gliding motility-associated protein GldE [Tannerella sp. CAG:118]
MDPDSLPLLFSSLTLSPASVGDIITLIFAVIFLGFSAFISASEIAFFSLSPQDINELEEERNPQDILIKSLLARSEYLLATILIANNLVNVAVVMLCTFFINNIIDFSNTPILGFIFQTIILTFLLLLFGEIMPKIYASHNALKFARKASHTLQILQKIFYPLGNFLVKSTQLINKHISHKNINISMNELSQALEMTKVDINEEKAMLEGIIKFGGKTVAEIMTSRIDMTDIDIKTNFKNLIKNIVENGYSRLPVYDGNEDNIKGIIYIKDLLPYLDRDENFHWQNLLRNPYFVPEMKMIDDLLEEFRSRKIHMAIVVDEFGGTSGIVTMEDILEEIVGEISDEYDEEEKQYTKIDNNTYIFEGKTLLNDFYKITGIPESDFVEISDEAETLAGLILEIKQDFPIAKEKINYGIYTFVVLEMNKRRIIKVKVKITPQENSNKEINK